MTETGVANRYAHALIEALCAPQSGLEARAALQSLQEFVETLGKSRDLELVMHSPSITPARKRAVIEKIAGRMELPKLIRNLLFVLSDHRRLPLVREISQAALTVLDERWGFLRADITAASPLSDDEQRELAEKLGQVTGKQIRVEVNVDPDLIGGVVARVGSTVYDGSVRGRLRAIGERLNSDEISSAAR